MPAELTSTKQADSAATSLPQFNPDSTRAVISNTFNSRYAGRLSLHLNAKLEMPGVHLPSLISGAATWAHTTFVMTMLEYVTFSQPIYALDLGHFTKYVRGKQSACPPDLSGAQRIFIPINQEKHWILADTSLNQHAVRIYDSLHGTVRAVSY